MRSPSRSVLRRTAAAPASHSVTASIAALAPITWRSSPAIASTAAPSAEPGPEEASPARRERDSPGDPPAVGTTSTYSLGAELGGSREAGAPENAGAAPTSA